MRLTIVSVFLAMSLPALSLHHIALSVRAKDLQSSLSLDPNQVQTGFRSNVQSPPVNGQVASDTSSNNFINFCATAANVPLTNGKQIKTVSCNAAPMGIIAATTNMPTSKFIFPDNMGTLKADQPFTIQMAINNLATGNFVNPVTNFLAAPQKVDTSGNVLGHTSFVIERLDSLAQKTPTDATEFAFFRGINQPAVNGVLSGNVTSGLPEGFYRLASINAAANHQPVLVSAVQRGSLDDMIYFSVTADGNPATPMASKAAAADQAEAAKRSARMVRFSARRV